MSLVGTRPPTVDEWELYEPHHRARMSFRPGLTGMWQVSGRSNITDFEEVVKLDTQYISEWSLRLDVKILWKTVYFNSILSASSYSHLSCTTRKRILHSGTYRKIQCCPLILSRPVRNYCYISIRGRT